MLPLQQHFNIEQYYNVDAVANIFIPISNMLLPLL